MEPTVNVSDMIFSIFGAIVLTAIIVSLIATTVSQSSTIDRLKQELKDKK